MFSFQIAERHCIQEFVILIAFFLCCNPSFSFALGFACILTAFVEFKTAIHCLGRAVRSRRYLTLLALVNGVLTKCFHFNAHIIGSNVRYITFTDRAAMQGSSEKQGPIYIRYGLDGCCAPTIGLAQFFFWLLLMGVCLAKVQHDCAVL